jgi:TRAP-type mannitol/chloroaromatic compound transport system permease small subunit
VTTVEAAGGILAGAAIALLFPLSMLPLAILFRSRAAGAAVWIGATIAVLAAGWIFASAAVDLEPPEIAAQNAAALAGALIVGALFAYRIGAGRLAATLAAPIEKLVRGVGRLSLYLVLAMAAAQFAIVVLRYVFGLNFIAMQESVTYLHGAVFLLAGGYALLTDDHVRVDILYRDAPPRAKAAVDFAGAYFFLFPFCFVALWAAGPYVANSWAVREGSVEQSGLPAVYLLKSLISAYLVLLALAGFVSATRAAQRLRRQDR